MLHSHKIIALQKPLKASPEKSQILSCDTLVANEQCALNGKYKNSQKLVMLIDLFYERSCFTTDNSFAFTL
jgi:hypothetical protein